MSECAVLGGEVWRGGDMGRGFSGRERGARGNGQGKEARRRPSPGTSREARKQTSGPGQARKHSHTLSHIRMHSYRIISKLK